MKVNKKAFLGEKEIKRNLAITDGKGYVGFREIKKILELEMKNNG